MLAVAWPAVWIRFDAAQRWPWAVLAVVLLVAVSVHRRSRFSSAVVFRMLSISGMLFALLEPVIGRPRNPNEAGPILLLLDVSQSMTAHDRLRTPRQRVALARALGRLPADAIDRALPRGRSVVSQLSQRVDVLTSTRAELDYARLLGRRSPDVRARFETAVKLLHDDAFSHADDFRPDQRLRGDVVALAGPGAAFGPARDTWLNRVSDLLRMTKSDLDRADDSADDAAYQSRADVRAACDAVSDLSRLDLERLAAMRLKQSIRGVLGTAVPVQTVAFGNGIRPIDLDSTDLNSLARSTFGRESQLNAAARSDGLVAGEPVMASVLFSDGRPVGDSAKRGEFSWPVFTVRVAKAGTLRDVSLSNLSVPTWAYRGQEVYGRVQVQSFGLASATVDLHCQLGDRRSEQSVSALENTAAVAAPHVMADNAGVQRFVLSVSPPVGEAIEGRGLIDRPLRVIDRTVRVLYIGDPNHAVPQKCVATLPFVRLTLIPPARPVEVPAVESTDVVVFGAFDPSQMSPLAWAALHKAVHDRGVGVVFLDESADSMVDIDDPAATELDPWEPGTFGSHRTAAASEMTLQPAGTEVGPLLGPLALTDQWLPDEPLPVASVPLLIDSETRVPILSSKRVGAGRSLLLTVTPAAPKSVEQSYRLARLWTTIVRDAASPPFAVETATQKLNVDPPAGDPSTVFHVRCETPGSQPPWIDVLENGRVVTRQAMLVTKRWAGVIDASATIARLPVGHYTVAIENAGGPAVDVDVTPTPTSEMENLTGRSDVLRRIARGSGGAMFELDDCDALVSRLKAVAFALRAPVEWHLSAGPQLLCFIVGCLAIDWALRKRAGLA